MDAARRLGYVRRVSRRWSLARRAVVDALIVLTAVEGAVEVLVRGDELRMASTPAWFAVASVVAVVSGLLARRRYPLAAPVSVWVLAAGLSFVDGRLVSSAASVYVAGLGAALLLGLLPDRARGRFGLAAVLGGAALVVVNSPGADPAQVVFVPAVFGNAWLAGSALRERAAQAAAAEERAAQAEREREESARRAVFEERVRIARELHDVVAHHVSMMGVQAGAARLVVDRDVDRAREALSAIELSSRQAVAELHRLLEFLRQDGDHAERGPQPGVAELPKLTQSLRDSDLAVELSIEGVERALPPTVDVSAYRIVQEALTNTLKHAAASRADVHLRYWPDEVEVEVVDDGRPASGGDERAGSTGPGGLGLIGMRERAALHDGQLTAGPTATGGFAVKARLRTPARAL